MATLLNYSVIKYSYNALSFDASGLRLVAAEDIPEGSIVKIDGTGKLALCGAADKPVGVSRFPVAQGGQCVAELTGVIENKGTSLALTPGASVFAAALGAVAGTGTTSIGTAISANKILVNIK